MNAALVLVRVIQAGSYRSAARLLGMPKSSVSRKVAELEGHLGAQLLHRTTRALSLTDTGAAFVAQAELAIAQFEAAEDAVSTLQRAPRGRLRISATVAMGQTSLAPLIVEFLQTYPAVEVNLHLIDRHADLIAERYDVALRAGQMLDSSLIAQSVGSAAFLLVASPLYLATHGTPKKPEDLLAHKCLRFVMTDATVRSTWPLGKGKRLRDVGVTGRLVADDYFVLHEAAVRGLGIARIPSVLAQHAVRKHQLVSVLDEYAPSAVPLQLVYLGGRNLPPRTRAFIDFMRPRLARAIEGGQYEQPVDEVARRHLPENGNARPVPSREHLISPPFVSAQARTGRGTSEGPLS